MGKTDPRSTAQNMIRLHGLQAQAIALQHLNEQRQQANAAELERWQSVHTAICELRRTGPGLNEPDARRSN
jgi:hypothetical protein